LLPALGAGDTFTAGFLHWLFANASDVADADLGPALRYAVTAAALACAHEGAQPPTAAEVDSALAE